MSWGTEVCIEAWEEIRLFVAEENRPYCLKVLIEAIESSDHSVELKEIKRKWPESILAIQLAEGDEDE
jgi:hypothetical protein